MKRVYQKLYAITLYDPISNKEEHSQVLLHVKEHKTMRKRIDEIVYVDENNKEWALKSIAPNDRRTT
jgi:hypothetical protein